MEALLPLARARVPDWSGRDDAAEAPVERPSRLRPRHLAQLVASLAVIGPPGLLAWRVARGEAEVGVRVALEDES